MLNRDNSVNNENVTFWNIFPPFFPLMLFSFLFYQKKVSFVFFSMLWPCGKFPDWGSWMRLLRGRTLNQSPQTELWFLSSLSLFISFSSGVLSFYPLTHLFWLYMGSLLAAWATDLRISLSHILLRSRYPQTLWEVYRDCMKRKQATC